MCAFNSKFLNERLRGENEAYKNNQSQYSQMAMQAQNAYMAGGRKDLPMEMLVPFTDKDGNLQPYNIQRSVVDSIKISYEDIGMLIQPIVVRPWNGKYQILAGHNRYTALTELGIKTAPCSIVTISDDEAMEHVILSNLAQRHTEEPSELARIFKYYHDKRKD